jgi:hypothetical protein
LPRRSQPAHGRIGRIVEGALDLLAGEIVHTAVKEPETLGWFLGEDGPEAANQVIQRRLVFRENDEPLIVAPVFPFAQMFLDQTDEPVETGILVWVGNEF